MAPTFFSKPGAISPKNPSIKWPDKKEGAGGGGGPQRKNEPKVRAYAPHFF